MINLLVIVKFVTVWRIGAVDDSVRLSESRSLIGQSFNCPNLSVLGVARVAFFSGGSRCFLLARSIFQSILTADLGGVNRLLIDCLGCMAMDEI